MRYRSIGGTTEISASPDNVFDDRITISTRARGSLDYHNRRLTNSPISAPTSVRSYTSCFCRQVENRKMPGSICMDGTYTAKSMSNKNTRTRTIVLLTTHTKIFGGSEESCAMQAIFPIGARSPDGWFSKIIFESKDGCYDCYIYF